MRPLLLILVLVLVLDRCPAADAKPFRAGAATSNITPFIGGNIVGGFNPFPSTNIHDELHARCLVLDDGTTQLAIVVCDLLGGEKLMFDEARRLVTEATGLPGANVLMSCTHTHSAASVLGADRFALQQNLDEYQRFVAHRIADGVRRAMSNLAPARIGWATAQEPREVFNRRWFMKPGTVPVNPFGETTDRVKMNPPRASKDLVKPAGPTDPEVCVLAVQTLEGRPISVLANYSLHYVGGVGSGDVSSDYYGIFCENLAHLLNADRQDPPFVALLSNGTSGNINNIDFTKPAEKRAPYDKMREVANHVAEAAQQAYQSIQWRDTATLGARLEMVEVGVRHPTPEQLARAKAIAAQPPKSPTTRTLEEVYAERTIRLNDWPATMSLPIQALRVGEVAIGGIPTEVFVEIGLQFKQHSPFKPSFIHSIANGYYGYLPTPEQHKLGGYETWLGTNRLEVDASTKIFEKLINLVTSMK